MTCELLICLLVTIIKRRPHDFRDRFLLRRRNRFKVSLQEYLRRLAPRITRHHVNMQMRHALTRSLRVNHPDDVEFPRRTRRIHMKNPTR